MTLKTANHPFYGCPSIVDALPFWRALIALNEFPVRLVRQDNRLGPELATDHADEVLAGVCGVGNNQRPLGVAAPRGPVPGLEQVYYGLTFVSIENNETTPPIS